MEDNKWRYITGMVVIVAFVASLTIIGTFSQSQSQYSVVFIFGMTVAISSLILLVLFRAPPKSGSRQDSGLLKEVLVATIAQVIASIVGTLVVYFLSH